ncbi:MAG: group I intron-associated PD-(D/E)XK endonuclease [Candidatus Sulfotelmatobacter sp.]
MSAVRRLGCASRLGSSSKSRSKSESKSKAAGGGARSTFTRSGRAANVTSKQRGELAEMMFMVKAAKKGFATAKPYGDSRRYDFIVDTGRRLWRVQVKSSSRLCKGAYHVSANRHSSGRTMAYRASEIDVVIAYVVPEDSWFVIPVKAFAPRKSLRLYPKGDPRGTMYGRFREAWGLMR